MRGQCIHELCRAKQQELVALGIQFNRLVVCQAPRHGARHVLKFQVEILGIQSQSARVEPKRRWHNNLAWPAVQLPMPPTTINVFPVMGCGPRGAAAKIERMTMARNPPGGKRLR